MNAETGFSQEGFDAVSRALERLYSGQEGIFYRTVIPYALGGKDPLDGIEVWKSEHGVPHWHYVTYGFTELYEKESDISQESGYGFELTFRLKRGAEEQPPAWPVNLLQNLARYVFSTGNGFGPGHHMSCNGPIALDTDTKLTALGFRVDPELGELDTPNGHMRFLQAVALTGDEMEAMMCWDGQRFLEELERCIPLCLTDLKRVSQMGQAAFPKPGRLVWSGMDHPLAFFIWTRWKRSWRTAAGTFVWEPAVLRFWPACFGRGWERGGICVCTAGTAQSAFVPVCGRCWRGKTVS